MKHTIDPELYRLFLRHLPEVEAMNKAAVSRRAELPDDDEYAETFDELIEATGSALTGLKQMINGYEKVHFPKEEGG